MGRACGPHCKREGERERKEKGEGGEGQKKRTSEKEGKERREATKTIKRKLDGVREKVQKGAREERASEREKEAANTVRLTSHLAYRDRVAGYRRAEGNCRRLRVRVVESFVREGTGKR